MSYNFVGVDREQLLLMPPSVADWLPEDHLAWFVLDAVDELDLCGFMDGYRVDGRGGAAYHPAMMVALLVYAYAVGERSSRGIQRRCVEDVAFRVVAANQVPDHATIARFRVSHAEAIAGLFGQVLALCARAGVLRVGLLAIDGTKITASASRDANRTAEQLAAEILDEAAAVDAAEDAQAADSDDGVVPDDLKGRGPRRRARLRELLDELEAEAKDKSFEAHLERRAEREAATGRPLRGRRPKPDTPKHQSRRHANTTDPDSRLMPTKDGFIQGYNAQTVVTEDQYVVAADITNRTTDAGSFAPMIGAAKTNLRRAGVSGRVRTVLADAGYWSDGNVHLAGVESLIAPGKSRKLGQIAEQNTARSALLARVEAGEIDSGEAARELGVTRSHVNHMLRHRRGGQAESLTTTMAVKLATPRGKRLYKKRAASVEPVFAQIKHNRRIRVMSRRGIVAADSEWKLITATHNLLKLWRHANLAT
ncbi:MAG: IS1182 family transposase [Ilumatobacteraceae bacterium]|nr:IS1182 family transposase [Ilumatobacteraceae bacterium]